MKFAIMFGNRGFFPGELIAGAIEDFQKVLTEEGYEYLMLPTGQTRYDAVETRDEGKIFADFLKAHEGEFDGVIVSMPNFSDENGATNALKDAGVPILVQAYPDEIGNMDFTHRRDSFCGKFALCNVLRQAKIPFTLTTEFVVSPYALSFREDLKQFAAICRIVKGMKSFNIGAVGARTTAFKTVRCDEIAMQNKGINIETFDLSLVFEMMKTADKNKVKEKAQRYQEFADCKYAKKEKIEVLARLGVVLDELIATYHLSAIGVRCWDEFQKVVGIAPCLAMAVLNQDKIPAACELDLDNAVMMRAISLAADAPVAVFDVNNNYGDEKDRCIFFHCSAVPAYFLEGKGEVSEHLMFKKSYGAGTGVGTFTGKCAPSPITVGSLKTEDGKICAFITEGEITDDPIEKDFFGCGLVFKKDDGDCEKMCNYMAENGYRHHVSFTKGNYAKAIKIAFETYLGYEIVRI